MIPAQAASKGGDMRPRSIFAGERQTYGVAEMPWPVEMSSFISFVHLSLWVSLLAVQTYSKAGVCVTEKMNISRARLPM